mgnify:CR=1 FL=1
MLYKRMHQITLLNVSLAVRYEYVNTVWRKDENSVFCGHGYSSA